MGQNDAKWVPTINSEEPYINSQLSRIASRFRGWISTKIWPSTEYGKTMQNTFILGNLSKTAINRGLFLRIPVEMDVWFSKSNMIEHVGHVGGQTSIFGWHLAAKKCPNQNRNLRLPNSRQKNEFWLENWSSLPTFFKLWHFSASILNHRQAFQFALGGGGISADGIAAGRQGRSMSQGARCASWSQDHNPKLGPVLILLSFWNRSTCLFCG